MKIQMPGMLDVKDADIHQLQQSPAPLQAEMAQQ